MRYANADPAFCDTLAGGGTRQELPIAKMRA